MATSGKVDKNVSTVVGASMARIGNSASADENRAW